MTWITVLAFLFCFVLLAALVSWGVLYIQFCYSPEKRWATKVLKLLRDAENCARSENRQLQALSTEREGRARSLREEVLAEHLRDYSVDELEEYPGIGPATVGKLRADGFTNLARLHHARIRIHGLGEKRLADIHFAIRNLLNKARSAFDAGDCRQAQALADRLGTLSAQYDRLEMQARTRATAAKEFVVRLGKTVEYARMATFGRWFRPISNKALIPPDIMDASLPDLEAALRTAEQQLAQGKTANRPRTPAHADSPGPISSARDECLILLEIPMGSPVTADLVRRQWNLLSERLAPAKVASMGAEFVQLAQTKLALLQRAAELLLEQMGEKLETQLSPPAEDLRPNRDLDDVFGGM